MPRYMQHASSTLKHPESRENELNRWLAQFGHRARHTITKDEIRMQVRTWQTKGVAASTIRHSLTALSQLYEVLDGDDAYNPVAGVKRPSEPRPAPDGRSPDDIGKVFAALEARVKRWNRGWKTLARAKVLAFTGMRPSQLGRVRPEHIRLDHKPPFVIVANPGKGGQPHVKPLSPEGVAAFETFIARNAFGEFSTSAFYKSWKLTWEAAEDALKDVPFFNPYKLRHSYASTLRAAGVDLADIQALLGHTTPRTTQRYAMVAPAKLVAAADALHRAWGAAKDSSKRQEQETERLVG